MEKIVEQLLADHREYVVTLEPGSYRVLQMNDLALALLDTDIESARFHDYRGILRNRFGREYRSEIERISPDCPVIRSVKRFPGAGIWLDIVYRGVIDDRGDVLFLRMVGRDVTALVEAYERIIALSARILSDREREMLVLVIAGKSRTQIAHEMDIALNTYDTMRKRIKKKFNITDPADELAFLEDVRRLFRAVTIL